jgi:hypothetical protein
VAKALIVSDELARIEPPELRLREDRLGRLPSVV